MSVTIVLNGFKRPHTTLQQYEAIKNQTYQDIEIIFWGNNTNNITFPETVIRNTQAIISNTDYGSWGRFVAALNARTEYVCVIDDDTIPGKKWIEHCFDTMQHNEGILSTRGVIANCGFDHLYPLPQSYTAVGWCNPNENTLRVDMGCHSWFFKKHWLRAYFAEMPTIFPMRYGEDTHISYSVKKHFDVNTYVPSHPKNDMDLWGSMPETAIKYGEEPVAISMDNNANYGMNQYWNFVRQMGYKLICEEK